MNLEPVYRFVDRLVGYWQSFRINQQVENCPDFQDFKLKSVEIKENTADFVFKYPEIGLLATGCAKLLNDLDATNSVQMRMVVPGIYRQVLVTVQWADGKSPNEVLAEKEEELRICQQKLAEKESNGA